MYAVFSSHDVVHDAWPPKTTALQQLWPAVLPLCSAGRVTDAAQLDEVPEQQFYICLMQHKVETAPRQSSHHGCTSCSPCKHGFLALEQPHLYSSRFRTTAVELWAVGVDPSLLTRGGYQDTSPVQRFFESNSIFSQLPPANLHPASAAPRSSCTAVLQTAVVRPPCHVSRLLPGLESRLGQLAIHA